jgi:hypothetical protein
MQKTSSTFTLCVLFFYHIHRYGLAVDKLADACAILEDAERKRLVEEIQKAQAEYTAKAGLPKPSTLTDIL